MPALGVAPSTIAHCNAIWKHKRAAKQLFGEQTLYALYDDDTEAEIENEEELESMFRRGIYVGTEVGFIDDNLNER